MDTHQSTPESDGYQMVASQKASAVITEILEKGFRDGGEKAAILVREYQAAKPTTPKRMKLGN